LTLLLFIFVSCGWRRSDICVMGLYLRLCWVKEEEKKKMTMMMMMNYN